MPDTLLLLRHLLPARRRIVSQHVSSSAAMPRSSARHRCIAAVLLRTPRQRLHVAWYATAAIAHGCVVFARDTVPPMCALRRIALY